MTDKIKYQSYLKEVQDIFTKHYPKLDEITMKSISRSFINRHNVSSFSDYIEVPKSGRFKTRVTDSKGLETKVLETLKEDEKIRRRLEGYVCENPLLDKMAEYLKSKKYLNSLEIQNIMGFESYSIFAQYARESKTLGKPIRRQKMLVYSAKNVLDFWRELNGEKRSEKMQYYP